MGIRSSSNYMELRSELMCREYDELRVIAVDKLLHRA